VENKKPIASDFFSNLKKYIFRFGEKMVEVKKENEKRTTVFIDRPGLFALILDSLYVYF